jgi:hypothetical protein
MYWNFLPSLVTQRWEECDQTVLIKRKIASILGYRLRAKSAKGFVPASVLLRWKGQGSDFFVIYKMTDTLGARRVTLGKPDLESTQDELNDAVEEIISHS